MNKMHYIICIGAYVGYRMDIESFTFMFRIRNRVMVFKINKWSYFLLSKLSPFLCWVSKKVSCSPQQYRPINDFN